MSLLSISTDRILKPNEQHNIYYVSSQFADFFIVKTMALHKHFKNNHKK